MPESSPNYQGKLAEIFSRINMSELPAMSVHVQELLAITSGNKSANYDDLAKIILNDYSLTNKVLQSANSAYYSLGQKVSTVSMAVAVLGFDSVRDMAIGIALYDDFIQAGVDEERISTFLARSFLAGLLARRIAESRYLQVLPEEAFICSLMRNLGKMIANIYLPAACKAIEDEMRQGRTEDEASETVLGGITYAELGREVATFWNMTDCVINTMAPDPDLAEEGDDAGKYLHNIVDFSNRYVEALWFLQDIESLMAKYSEVLSIDRQEAVGMLCDSVARSGSVFESIYPGVKEFDFRRRLEQITPESGEASSGTEEKRIEDFWIEMKKMVKGPFRLNDFFSFLLDALYRGIGFDRVILSMLQVRDGGKKLAGQMGYGDITVQQIQNFQVSLSETKFILVESLTMCKDMAMNEERKDAFPEHLQYLLKNRVVYLFPICLGKRGVALLYLDRKNIKPKLDKAQVQYVRKFRDIAEKVIKMKRK